MITLNDLTNLAVQGARKGYKIVGTHPTTLALMAHHPSGEPARAADPMEIMTAICAEWLHHGLPAVEVLGPVALARMATYVPARRPLAPWSAWVMVFGAGADVVFTDAAGRPDRVALALCYCDRDERWSYMALCSRVEYVELSREPEYLYDGEYDHREYADDVPYLPLVEGDHSNARRLNRVILATHDALGELDGVRRLGAERAASKPGRYPAGTYVIG